MTALAFEGAARVAAPARPAMVTRDLLAKQFVLLAQWDLESPPDDHQAETAAARLGARPVDFDAVCDTVLTLEEIEAGDYRYGTFDDPDMVERLAREKHEDALAPLIDAAMVALRGGR